MNRFGLNTNDREVLRGVIERRDEEAFREEVSTRFLFANALHPANTNPWDFWGNVTFAFDPITEDHWGYLKQMVESDD